MFRPTKKATACTIWCRVNTLNNQLPIPTSWPLPATCIKTRESFWTNTDPSSLFYQDYFQKPQIWRGWAEYIKRLKTWKNRVNRRQPTSTEQFPLNEAAMIQHDSAVVAKSAALFKCSKVTNFGDLRYGSIPIPSDFTWYPWYTSNGFFTWLNSRFFPGKLSKNI